MVIKLSEEQIWEFNDFLSSRQYSLHDETHPCLFQYDWKLFRLDILNRKRSYIQAYRTFEDEINSD